MEEMLMRLADYGALGIIVGFLLWQNSRINAKLVQIIEDNTAALSELKGIIKRSVERHKDP